jgi:TRAP-type C4-dicarboxylate transport system permease small subunit
MTKKVNDSASAIETVFEKVVLYLDRFLLGIGGVAVVLIMTLATVNVILRLFSLPLRGVYEIITYMGAVSIAAALGYTQRRKDHIIVDIISEKYGRRTRRVADTISYLCMTVFFLLIAKTLFTWGLIVSSSGEVSETLKIAYYPFVLFVSAGFAMLSVTCFADTVRTLFNLKVRNVE